MSDLKRILATTELFSKLESSDLDAITLAFKEETYPTNTDIIKKGEMGDSLFIIAKGKTKVHDGNATLAELETGAFFGEMAFFDSSPRSMSVTSESPCILYRMNREGFQSVFRERPHILQHMVSAITNRIRKQNERIISDLKSRETELKLLVEARTVDLAQRNEDLSKALTELKSTQDKLVQQEKLALLGQLTAGIAHEIKNPLNFVTNFAKVSFELLDDLITSKNEIDREEAGDFLRQNLNKIFEHGSRADSIVKGMLEHTRANREGQQQLENLNTICEQFLKIAMESYTISNKGFTVETNLAFDKKAPMVMVASLDISKVFLNLFTNALYSMNEKAEKIQGFKPVLTITSQFANNQILFTIQDNGTGISPEHQSKIFNPFFTTKPTGKGTGLGLSITHDIIKSHGGTISCESVYGEGAVFKLTIPVKGA
jgi:signal transduction histidine kinase